MQDSIFTKIIKGELPSYKIYEDDKTLAFLDIFPVMPGMVVVIAKQQVANFEDLDDETHTALWVTVKKVAKKLRSVFPDAKKIAVQVEGLEVPHTHVKVFPIYKLGDFSAKSDPESNPTTEELTAMAERLRF